MEQVHLILVGDTGSGSPEQDRVAKSMEKLVERYPVKAILLMGDNIYEEGVTSIDDEQFETKFKIPYQHIHLPFYLCLGNHDYGNGATLERDAIQKRVQSQIDYTTSAYNTSLRPDLKKWNMPSKWYTQSFPLCDVFFIDTNMDPPGGGLLSESSIQEQLKDTIHAIKQSGKQWKIVCGHHTWRSVGGHSNAEERFEQFMKDLLAEVKIDLYVCGHDHCKSIIEVGRHKTRALVIGTGGKQYDEDLYYPDNMKADGSKLKFFSPNLGVCHFKATKDTLTLTCYTETLRKEKTYTISKRSKKTNSRRTRQRTRRRRKSKRSKRRRRRRN